jgi:hypothetical protein
MAKITNGLIHVLGIGIKGLKCKVKLLIIIYFQIEDL